MVTLIPPYELAQIIGDAVEVVDVVSGQPTQIPLAGPANRQGRIAADQIMGRDSRYRGTQGTAVVGIFEMTADRSRMFLWAASRRRSRNR